MHTAIIRHGSPLIQPSRAARSPRSLLLKRNLSFPLPTAVLFSNQLFDLFKPASSWAPLLSKSHPDCRPRRRHTPDRACLADHTHCSVVRSTARFRCGRGSGSDRPIHQWSPHFRPSLPQDRGGWNAINLDLLWAILIYTHTQSRKTIRSSHSRNAWIWN